MNVRRRSQKMPMIPRTALLNSLLLIVAVQLAVTDGGKVHVVGSSEIGQP